MPNASRRITVIGGGTWGSTLALLGARGGHDVRLWMRNATIAAETEQTRRNGRALPGVDFPKSIQFTSDLEFACQSSTAIFIATASTAVRTIARSIAPLAGNAIVVSCSKGLEVDSLKRMSEVLYEE